MRRGLTPAVVGAVSELFQGDLDFGRHVLERLERDELGSAVALEPFDYGAIAVVQRLEELAPELLVLVGATGRGDRAPGTLQRREVKPLTLPRAVVGQAVAEAVTGYVTMDLLIEVASGLGALPVRTVAIELQPIQAGPCVELSPRAQAAVGEATELVREELGWLQPSPVSPASSAPSA